MIILPFIPILALIVQTSVSLNDLLKYQADSTDTETQVTILYFVMKLLYCCGLTCRIFIAINSLIEIDSDGKWRKNFDFSWKKFIFFSSRKTIMRIILAIRNVYYLSQFVCRSCVTKTIAGKLLEN